MRIHPLLPIATLLCVNLIGAEGRLSPRFRTVYILEMANGLDQHLANRLTVNRALWVVLEPSSADAVLTPTLDDSFWTWLSANFPAAAGARPNGSGPAGSGPGSRREAKENAKQPGMVFLVDPRSRVVLWSAWEIPKRSTPLELDHTAERIATQLKAAFEKK